MDDRSNVVHLMTQMNQPYGSERRCCEVCGLFILGNPRFKDRYVDSPEQFRQLEKPFIRCNERKQYELQTSTSPRASAR